MKLKIIAARELLAPGFAAMEVLACDISCEAGRRAVRLSCGKQILRRLRNRRTQFVAVMIGGAGIRVVECTDVVFAEIGAEMIECTRFVPGPIVVSRFGVSADMNERIVQRAKCRDLETVEPLGSA